MKKKDEHVVSPVIREMGTIVRQRIRALPVKHQALAWASIAAAITAAGIHDSEEPQMVISLVQAAIEGMGPYLAEKMLRDLEYKRNPGK